MCVFERVRHTKPLQNTNTLVLLRLVNKLLYTYADTDGCRNTCVFILTKAKYLHENPKKGIPPKQELKSNLIEMFIGPVS